MDIYNTIQAQLGILGVMLAAAANKTHKEIQESEVALPQTFAGNEEGWRTISKKDLEALIDNRWKCDFQRLPTKV
jgi:hypothetical protein